MRSDDLAPLLAPTRTPVAGVRQGVVVAWDAITYANTVDVGGQELTNLPVLNSSDAALVAAGDVVSILTFGASWLILGRITVPT